MRAATLETATSWERAEAGIGADAEPVAGPEEEAGLRADERVARLRAEWS